MFNTKKDKYIVNVSIDFDVYEIERRIKGNKSLLALTEDEKKPSFIYKQDHNINIDFLPYGKNTIAYYHRNDNSFSQAFSKQQVPLDDNLKVSWSFRGNQVTVILETEEKSELLLVTPTLQEVEELMSYGKIKNNKDLRDFGEEKVTINLSKNETAEVMKSGAGGVSESYVGFRNDVCGISFSTTYYEGTVI